MKEVFINLLQHYTNSETAEALWNELYVLYNSSSRRYHNISHLDNVYRELLPFLGMVKDADTVLFALFYHDAVYNTSRKDNEEKSALLARKRLRLVIDEDRLLKCAKMILATKQHLIADDYDTNLFTDADLSILGAPWMEYEQYFKNIRKEYSIYPDLLYNAGRKKVLRHFLEMDYIFKTDAFKKKHEERAKQNITAELKLL